MDCAETAVNRRSLKAILLCLLLLVSFFLEGAEILHAEDHECTGEDCLVCHVLKDIRESHARPFTLSREEKTALPQFLNILSAGIAVLYILSFRREDLVFLSVRNNC